MLCSRQGWNNFHYIKWKLHLWLFSCLHKIKIAQSSWRSGFLVVNLQFLHFVLPCSTAIWLLSVNRGAFACFVDYRDWLTIRPPSSALLIRNWDTYRDRNKKKPAKADDAENISLSPPAKSYFMKRSYLQQIVSRDRYGGIQQLRGQNFAIFCPPPPLRRQFLYPQCGQKQTFFFLFSPPPK